MRFNILMAKTQRELAFLRDLYIQDEWTKRFTDLVDKHMDLSDSENMLYINAGTGTHAMAIFDRFGEIFSLMWEVLFNEDLAEHGAAVEKLITGLPTVSSIEQIAERAGIVNRNTQTAVEVFEYDNGEAFIASPLVAEFLMPAWLEM